MEETPERSSAAESVSVTSRDVAYGAPAATATDPVGAWRSRSCMEDAAPLAMVSPKEEEDAEAWRVRDPDVPEEADRTVHVAVPEAPPSIFESVCGFAPDWIEYPAGSVSVTAGANAGSPPPLSARTETVKSTPPVRRVGAVVKTHASAGAATVESVPDASAATEKSWEETPEGKEPERLTFTTGLERAEPSFTCSTELTPEVLEPSAEPSD